MMFRFAFRFVLLLLVAVAAEGTSHLTSGPHVADVNILLPPKMTNPVEYRLQGSDGCFKWYVHLNARSLYFCLLFVGLFIFWLICD